MKKIITRTLPIIVVALFLVSCSSSNDWKKAGLKGRVKSLEVTRYRAIMNDDDEWEKVKDGFVYKVVTEYDKKGYYTTEENYNEDDELLRRSEPERNKKNQLVEVTNYNRDDEVESVSEIEIISPNSHEFKLSDNDDNILAKGESEFKKNRLVRHEYTSYHMGEKEFRYSAEFEYNKKGMVVEVKTKHKTYGEYGDSFKYTTEVEYLEFDKRKNWTRSIEYDEDEEEESGILVEREIEYY